MTKMTIRVMKLPPFYTHTHTPRSNQFSAKQNIAACKEACTAEYSAYAKLCSVRHNRWNTLEIMEMGPLVSSQHAVHINLYRASPGRNGRPASRARLPCVRRVLTAVMRSSNDRSCFTPISIVTWIAFHFLRFDLYENKMRHACLYVCVSGERDSSEVHFPIDTAMECSSIPWPHAAQQV